MLGIEKHPVHGRRLEHLGHLGRAELRMRDAYRYLACYQACLSSIGPHVPNVSQPEITLSSAQGRELGANGNLTGRLAR